MNNQEHCEDTGEIIHGWLSGMFCGCDAGRILSNEHEEKLAKAIDTNISKV